MLAVWNILLTDAPAFPPILAPPTLSLRIIWTASRENGPSDILNGVDQDQPLYDVENTYT